jgi:hypothetical protein
MMAHCRIACARREEDKDIGAELPQDSLRIVKHIVAVLGDRGIFLPSTRIESVIGRPSNRRDDWV